MGFKVFGLRLRAQGLGLRVKRFGFRAEGADLRQVWGPLHRARPAVTGTLSGGFNSSTWGCLQRAYRGVAKDIGLRVEGLGFYGLQTLGPHFEGHHNDKGQSHNLLGYTRGPPTPLKRGAGMTVKHKPWYGVSAAYVSGCL